MVHFRETLLSGRLLRSAVMEGRVLFASAPVRPWPILIRPVVALLVARVVLILAY